MSTLLYDKSQNAIFPWTYSSSVYEDNWGDVQTAINELKKLLEDIKSNSSNSGSSTGGNTSGGSTYAVTVNIEDNAMFNSNGIDVLEYSSVPCTVTFSHNVTNATTMILTIYINNTILDTLELGSLTEYYEFHLPAKINLGTTIIKAVLKVGNYEGSDLKKIIVTANSMLFWKEEDEATFALDDSYIKKASSLSGLSGTYTAPGGKYLWIVTPQTLTSFTMGGFPCPYKTFQKNNYNIYRQTILPDKGTKMILTFS